jgi:phosphoglycolate phosphatase
MNFGNFGNFGTDMRGILFDKDGTLLDFEASWNRAYVELAFDLASGDEKRATAMMVAGGLDVATGRIKAGTALAAGNTIDIARAWFPDHEGGALGDLVLHMDEVFHQNGLRFSVAVAGLNETLVALAEMGLAMGVATSDSTAGAKAALKSLGVDRHLPHIFGYDSVPFPKPAPDMVHAFAAAAGLQPAEIAVVGDNRHDLEMARSAGAGLAIGVLSGTGAQDDLAPLADVILADIRALPEWLHQNRK